MENVQILFLLFYVAAFRDLKHFASEDLTFISPQGLET